MKFIDFGSQLSQFTSQVANPIRFLVSIVSNPTHCRAPFGEHGDGCKCLNRIADVAHVNVDPALGPPRNSNRIRPVIDIATLRTPAGNARRFRGDLG